MSLGISQYPYLFFVVVVFAIFLCCYILSRSYRKTLLLAGVLSAPGSLLTFFLVPEYWEPIRLFGWEPGIEDVLFSFTTGAIVWFFAVVLRFDKTLMFHINWKTGVRRYLKVVVIGIVVFALASLLESVHVMGQVLITMLATALLIAKPHRDTYYIALSTSVLFGMFYTISIVVAFQVIPDFASHWHRENLWTSTFLSVPMEEIVWALTFGFTWTLIMFYTLDVKHQEKG